MLAPGVELSLAVAHRIALAEIKCRQRSVNFWDIRSCQRSRGKWAGGVRCWGGETRVCVKQNFGPKLYKQGGLCVYFP